MAKSKVVTKIIAMDSGKFNLKAMESNGKSLIFRNKITKGRNIDLGVNKGNTYNVTYNEEKYVVGNGGNYSDSQEGKATEEHKISTLTAITQFLDKESKGEEVILIYGESVNKYYSATQRKEIKNMFEGRHQIVVDDIEYDFTITKAHILLEGLGCILENYDQFTGMQYIVDIGGKTINFLTVNNAIPIEQECTSYGMGVNNIVSKTVESLHKAGYDLRTELVDEFIREGATTKQVQQIIDNEIEDQLDMFDNALGNKGINIHSILKVYKVNFIGGGSELFKDYIAKHYGSNANVIENAVYSNVKGFCTYGESVYGE